MALYNAKFVGVFSAGRAAVDRTALDAIVHVRLVNRPGRVQLCALKVDILLDGNAEGHAGRGEAAFSGHRFFRRGGRAAASRGTTCVVQRVVRGLCLGLLVIVYNVWGRETKSVGLERLLGETPLLGRHVRRAERRDW